MRFAGLSALTLLLATSSAIPTKRQALIDSIGGSSLDDVIADIKNNGNISLLGDLIEVAIDALSTEASAVAECYNPSASTLPGSGSSGPGGVGAGAGAGAGVGVGVGGSGASSPSAAAAVAELSSLIGSVASAATAGPNAANAASSALNFLSTATPAVSVSPEISSLLSSIAANTAAVPTGAVSSLAGAASGAPSQLSSFLGSVASEVGAEATSAPNAAGQAASSALGFLSTANPAASVAPAISSLLSSIAANPAATIPANIASSLAGAASSVGANLPGVTAGAGVGANVGGSVGGFPGPALSSLLSDPAVTGAPGLGSAIGSLTNPGASVGPSLSSVLSSILANPSASLPTGEVSSLVSAISSAANNGGGIASPATNTRASSGASSSSTPIACPFSSKSTYSVLGSQFTRYCNEFYGGNVLNIGNAVAKRQAAGSLNTCASICAPNARCLGTQYNPSTGACTFYSSLTNGVTRNGVQFALRSSAASSILPPVSAGATGSAGVSAGVPSGVLSSLASEASTATGPLGSEISSLISQLSTASAINTGALSSLLSELPTATSLPGGLISSALNAGSSGVRPSLPGLSSVVLPTGIASLTSQVGSVATSAASSVLSDASSIINSLTSGGASVPSSIISSVLSEATGSVSSILSGASSEIASITSGLGSVTGPITLPPGATASAITTSCGGALVDLCATIGLLDGVSINLGIGGSAGATPTRYSGVPGQFTSTSTQCSGLVCLAVGLGSSTTATLGALQTDGTILDLGAGIGGGSDPVITSVPSVSGGASISFPDITGISTSCSNAVCATIGLGPLASITLGAIPTDGSDGLIGVSAGVLPTPTTVAGAEITAISTTCDSLVCLSLGVGPSATLTLGLIGASNVAGISAGLPTITAPAVIPTSAVIDGNTVTAISTSCGVGGVVDACVSLGLGPLGTITLGAGALESSALVSAGVSATLLPSLTNGAVLPTSFVTDGNTITALSASCTGNLVDACVTLGLGNLGTVSVNAGALPTGSSGALISAGAGGTLLPSLTNGQVIPTSTIINGNTITAVSASCSGAALNACATVGLGNLGTIALNAGVLPTSGGLASLSAAASIGASGTTAAPAVTSPPVLATVSGNAITSLSTSCGTGSLVNVCATIGLGPLGGVTLNAGVLGSTGVLGASAGVSLLPGQVYTTTRTTSSCSGGVLGVLGSCTTFPVTVVATAAVAKREPTTLAKVVRN